MIKYQKLPADILDRFSDAKEYFEENDKIVFAYLFGGLAENRITQLTDVDLAVYIKSSEDLPKIKIDILDNLMRILGTDEIDLVILNKASLPLAARIINKKRLLTDKDPFFRHKFESLTLREYFDFSLKEQQIMKLRYSID